MSNAAMQALTCSQEYEFKKCSCWTNSHHHLMQQMINHLKWNDTVTIIHITVFLVNLCWLVVPSVATSVQLLETINGTYMYIVQARYLSLQMNSIKTESVPALTEHSWNGRWLHTAIMSEKAKLCCISLMQCPYNKPCQQHKTFPMHGFLWCCDCCCCTAADIFTLMLE